MRLTPHPSHHPSHKSTNRETNGYATQPLPLEAKTTPFRESVSSVSYLIPSLPLSRGFLTLPEGLMRRTYDKGFIALSQREYEI
mgnify:CR=1 FL=1